MNNMPSNNPNHKKNLKPFPKGKSGNEKGRPKKVIKQVLQELKDAGFEKITLSQVHELYEYLLTIPAKDLKKMSAAQDTPIIQRTVAKAIMKGTDFTTIETMLSRLYGKPKQQTDLNGTFTGDIHLTIGLADDEEEES